MRSAERQRHEWIELSDLQFAEANRELTRRGGGVALDEAGSLLLASATTLPVLFNSVMRTGPGPDARDLFVRADRFFAERARGYTVILRAHAADDDLRTLGAERGITAFGDMPAMILDHRLDDVAPAPGVTLTRVETHADAAAFAAVMGDAYATYGMPPNCAPEAISRLTVQNAPHIHTFLARVDDKPAAGAMTILSHGIGGIYWVGTTPTARGHGLAELCTRAAGNRAFDLGATAVTLQASVMGDPIYRRMGYFEVTRYPYLVRFDVPESSVA